MLRKKEIMIGKIDGFSRDKKIRRIGNVQFGIFSPQEIEKMSVCEIKSSDLKKDFQQIHSTGGFLDPRMGPYESKKNCQTCGGKTRDCTGHFGFIKLSKPLYHPSFIPKIQKILSCVCYFCGKLLKPSSKEEIDLLENSKRIKDLRKRFLEVYKLCKEIKKCQECSKEQPEITSSKSLTKISVRFRSEEEESKEEKKKRLLSPQSAIEILRKISSEDCGTLLGQSTRPEFMILKNLPIPPAIPIRPTSRKLGNLIFMSEGEEYEDTFRINTTICEILSLNDEINILLSSSSDSTVSGYEGSVVVNDLYEMLGFRVNKYLSLISERIGGRIRKNLMGKTVDFCARSVVTPDPNLSIDEVGVPLSVCMNLTIPETVTSYNFERLTNIVRNGPSKYPGAKCIIINNKRKNILGNNGSLKLKKGWVVERHLQNGDVVLMNKQPSTDKVNMMGHKVKVLPYSSFRLNESVISLPYGNGRLENSTRMINLHVPQSVLTRSELEEFMMVSQNIILHQNISPVLGFVQDSIMSSYLISKRDSFLSRRMMMNCLMQMGDLWDGRIPMPSIIKPEQLWTGKQIISVLLSPAKVNLERRNNSFNMEEQDRSFLSNDSLVVIKNGILLCGILDKKVLGAGRGSLLDFILRDKGNLVAKNFIETMQKVTTYFLLQNGFSLGIKDFILDRNTQLRIQHGIGRSKRDIRQAVNQVQRGQMHANPGKTLLETFEDHINRIFNMAQQDVSSIAIRSMRTSNNLRLMSCFSGSAGNEIYVSKIVGMVGQVTFDSYNSSGSLNHQRSIFGGDRVGFGFKHRTLPHFFKADNGPESRGFVESSFYKGLNPSDFFFHAMRGREMILSSNRKFKKAGYVQRKLVKCLEDIHIAYDGTVRDGYGENDNNILQFLYGEDGMDATKIEFQTFPTWEMSDSRFLEMFKHEGFHKEQKVVQGSDEIIVGFAVDEKKEKFMEYASPLVRKSFLGGGENLSVTFFQLLEDEYTQIVHDRELLREEIFLHSHDVYGNNVKTMPVNLEKLIENVQHKYPNSENNTYFQSLDYRVSDLNPIDVILEVQNLIKRLVVIRKLIRGEDPIHIEEQSNAILLFSILLRSTLASKRVLKEYILNEKSFKFLISEIERLFLDSIAHPGENVGVIAAQSIPFNLSNQLMLLYFPFHMAGVSTHKIESLGLLRFKELLNGVKKIETPRMFVKLESPYAFDKEEIEEMNVVLECVTIKDLTEAVEIYYDPLRNDFVTSIERDKELVQIHFSLSTPEEQDISNYSPWLLRLKLRNREMSNFDMYTISEKIENEFGNENVLVICEDNFADELIVRIRIIRKSKEEEDDVEDDLLLLYELKDLLMKLKVRGFKNIKKCFIRQTTFSIFTEEGRINHEREWGIICEGVDLLPVLTLDHVDYTRTTSNSVIHILEVLGIEAARQSLLNELKRLVEIDGSYLSTRHFMVLADKLCFSGKIVPLSDCIRGVLLKASLGNTCDVFDNAAMFSLRDPVQGVSACIINGKNSRVGTGYFDVFSQK